MTLTRNFRRIITLGLLPTILFALYLGHATAAHADTAGFTACSAEDSPGPCYWDATTRGNHRGHSFWVDNNQKVHYMRHFTNWHPVHQALADALAEGDAAPRVWETCFTGRLHQEHKVICADGYSDRW